MAGNGSTSGAVTDAGQSGNTITYRWYVTSATSSSATYVTSNVWVQAGDIRERDFDKAVDAKARELLLKILSQRQRAEFEEKDAFDVEAPSGRLYRVKRKWAGGIIALNKKREEIAELCLVDNVEKQEIPVDDLLVARKLMIESAEDEFLKIANFHWGQQAFAKEAA